MNKPIIKETKEVRITISYTNPILRWLLGQAEIKIEAVEKDPVYPFIRRCDND